MNDAELYEALSDFQRVLKVWLIADRHPRPRRAEDITRDFYDALNRFDQAVIDLGIRVAQEAQRGEEKEAEGGESLAGAD